MNYKEIRESNLFNRLSKTDGGRVQLEKIFLEMFPRFKGLNQQENELLVYNPEEKLFFATLVELKIHQQEKLVERTQKRFDDSRTESSADAVDTTTNIEGFKAASLALRKDKKFLGELLSARSNNHGVCAHTGNTIFFQRMLAAPVTSKSLRTKLLAVKK